MNNKDKYTKLMKQLILQGLVRLMEEEVYVRVREDDVEMVKGMLKDIQKDFKQFIKESINKEMKVELKMYPKDGLVEDYIGGVILYCNGFKIVFDNTLKARL